MARNSGENAALSVDLLKTRIAAVLARFGGRVSSGVLMLECFPPAQYPQAWRQLSEDGSAGCALTYTLAKALLLAVRELGAVRISGVEGGIFAPEGLQLAAPGEPLIASEPAARG